MTRYCTHEPRSPRRCRRCTRKATALRVFLGVVTTALVAFLSTSRSLAVNHSGDPASSVSPGASALECGDVDASGSVTTADALAVLGRAVGLALVSLNCPEICETASTATGEPAKLRTALNFPCGDLDGDGAVHTNDALRLLRRAMGLPAELQCPVCALTATETRTARVNAGPAGAFFHTLVGGRGRATLLWSPNSSDVGWIASRAIDPSLEVDSVSFAVGLVEDRSLETPAACASGDDLVLSWADAVAWQDLSTEPTPNPVDVTVRLPGVADFRANENVLGRQELPYIACLPDGRVAITWRSLCLATIREDGYAYSVRPTECDFEPADGFYLRIFHADGTPAGNSQLVTGPKGYGGMFVAGASDDRLVVVTERRIEVRTTDGQILQTRSHALVSSEDGFLECVENHCVTGDGESVVRFAVDDLAGAAPIVVRETEHPDASHWIQPFEVRVACDGSGACLATWSLFQETRSGSSNYFDFLGNFARPFSLFTGILGAEIRLEDPHGMAEGPLVTSIAPGTFVVWIGESGGFTLHRVDVE